ncbi:hypothetical protein A4X13_0g3545 [Tilletia indica]|uniref:Uncharacterized protein n=1 Tax=Tilletia indica TaxID=43049 RepID=A0A177TTG3_9BASI|nr:hypothetical protein A4X13_0g3545 [Tilletia indica]
MARKRTTAAQKKAAVKKELVDVKPIQTAAAVAGPSTPSSSFASSSNAKVKVEKKSASPIVKKDPDEDSDGSSMDEGDDELCTPANPYRVAPLLTPGSASSEYGDEAQSEDDGSEDEDLEDDQYDDDDEEPENEIDVLVGGFPLFYGALAQNLDACSICGSDNDVQYASYPNDPIGIARLFCKYHKPKQTICKSAAIKHFAQYKNVGGNLNNIDLLEAEIEGTVRVRYDRNPNTPTGVPEMRIYWIRELYALSRAKVVQKREEALAKQAEKERKARIKRAEQLERKAEADRVRAAKKARQDEDKAAKKAQKQAAAALARQRKSAQAGNSAEAGPSSSVTVTSTLVIEVSGDDEDESMAPQVPPPSIPAAAPQPNLQRYRVKPEPGLEIPMLPPNASLSVSDGQSFQVKQEA